MKITRGRAAMFLIGWRNAKKEENEIFNEVIDVAIEALTENLQPKETPLTTDENGEEYGVWLHGPSTKKRYCSKCNHDRPYAKVRGNVYTWNSPYCPNCGIPMKGDK